MSGGDKTEASRRLAAAYTELGRTAAEAKQDLQYMLCQTLKHVGYSVTQAELTLQGGGAELAQKLAELRQQKQTYKQMCIGFFDFTDSEGELPWSHAVAVTRLDLLYTGTPPWQWRGAPRTGRIGSPRDTEHVSTGEYASQLSGRSSRRTSREGGRVDVRAVFHYPTHPRAFDLEISRERPTGLRTPRAADNEHDHDHGLVHRR